MIVVPVMNHLKKLLVISLVQISLVGLSTDQIFATLPFSGPDSGIQFKLLSHGHAVFVAQTVTSDAAPSEARRSSLNLQLLGGWLVFAGLPIVAMGAIWYALRQRPQSPGTAESLGTSLQPVGTSAQSSDIPKQAASEAKLTESIGSAEQPVPLEQTQLSPEPAVASTTRLAKVDIVEALIADLQHPDRTKRCQAIWELGQRGDSRAVQPLVDTLVEADSQQRGLILAAIAEISTRTLKPVNRALMLSLQDDSADVRKNAIRDATRIYDSMAQVSQLLQYAAHDADTEVQETAQWALGQLNRLSTQPEIEAIRSLEKSPDLPNAGDIEA